MQITKNLFYISNEEAKISVKNFKLSPPQHRPLVIMPTWLMAVDKHIYKYANIYLRYDFDVLNVQIQLWQLLWPRKGTQILALEILKFLESNKSNRPLLIHGFSIGGYLWGEVLVHIEADRERYQFVIDNMAGQIWDSPADITRIPAGISYATFPNSKFLQNALKSYANYHLKTFDESATRHYLKSRKIMFDNLIRTPILMLASKADVVSSEDTIREVCDYWEHNGIKVFLKLWDDSLHVCHMNKHPKDYTNELRKFLEYIQLINQNNLQANL